MNDTLFEAIASYGGAHRVYFMTVNEMKWKNKTINCENQGLAISMATGR